MAELQFSFQEALDEVAAMSAVAEPFVSAECVSVLEHLHEELRSFRGAPSATTFSWGIPETRPLYTQVSEGEYERGRRRGSLRVYAGIASIWRIAQVREGIGKTKVAQRFALAGEASTRVQIFSATDNSELAMWRMEIGDSSAPGCHFHVQVRGQDEALPFPKALSVPRLPAIHSSPTAVIEFVLSELFQDRWDQHVFRQTPALERWAVIQRQRLVKQLAWQLETVGRKAVGSPWVALKREKPEAELFVS